MLCFSIIDGNEISGIFKPSIGQHKSKQWNGPQQYIVCQYLSSSHNLLQSQNIYTPIIPFLFLNSMIIALE